MLQKIYTLILLHGLLIAQLAVCQVTPESKIKKFNTRLINPVDVDIQEGASGATITINNRSYFRYLIQIKFTSVVNLKTAQGQVRNYIMPNGFHRLGSIPAIDGSQPVDLAFVSTSQICPSNNEKGDFTYLYPIGNSKKLKEYLYKENENIYRNMYRMKKGDTVYCMRRGILTNIIRNEGLADRLGPEGSVEILHEDGTVMVYTGISRNFENLKRGDIIYPGQPIGIMEDEQNIMTTFLCYIQPDASIAQINIKYPEDCFASLVKSMNSDCIVTYPSDLIQSEMSKSEKKKYLAGKLF